MSTRAWGDRRLAPLWQAVALHHDPCWLQDVFRMVGFTLTKRFEILSENIF